MEENGVPNENHRPVTSSWQIYHIMLYWVHLAISGFKLTILVVIMVNLYCFTCMCILISVTMSIKIIWHKVQLQVLVMITHSDHNKNYVNSDHNKKKQCLSGSNGTVIVKLKIWLDKEENLYSHNKVQHYFINKKEKKRKNFCKYKQHKNN